MTREVFVTSPARVRGAGATGALALRRTYGRATARDAVGLLRTLGHGSTRGHRSHAAGNANSQRLQL